MATQKLETTVQVDGHCVIVRGLSLAALAQIARTHASVLGPVVQQALTETLGGGRNDLSMKHAATEWLQAAPEILATIIRAGVTDGIDCDDLTLGVRAQILGVIIRYTLEEHSLAAVLSAMIMPSLTAGIISNPLGRCSTGAAVN